MQKNTKKINRLRFSFALSPVLLFCLCLNTFAGNNVDREYRVKAAFVYNFARFTLWPDSAFASPDSPVTICVYGNDFFGNSFTQFIGKKIKNRKLVIKKTATLSHHPPCQIIFISKAEKESLPEILKKLAGKPVLLVSDIENFADQGGTIGLLKIDNKIRFDINLDTARNDHLQISSHLLKLGHKVISSKKEQI